MDVSPFPLDVQVAYDILKDTLHDIVEAADEITIPELVTALQLVSAEVAMPAIISDDGYLEGVQEVFTDVKSRMASEGATALVAYTTAGET